MGTRKFKKVQAKKTREIKNPFFCNFKNDQKSIFEIGKSSKPPKMQFHENFFWIYLVSRVFLLGLF